MGFHWRYMDDSPHQATFESATRALQHFLMRSGLPSGPSFAAIYNNTEWKDRDKGIPSKDFYYEAQRAERGKSATVWHNGETFLFTMSDEIKED